MRVVGRRRQYDISLEPSAEKLVAAARWNDSFARPADPGLCRQGVYLYSSHEEAELARIDAAVKRVVAVVNSQRRA